MRDDWVQGRFEGIYSGDRCAAESGDPDGARRFGFEILSGELRDLELIPAPLETDAPGEQKEIRQDRIKRVRLPLIVGEAPRERPLFDVRIREWSLHYPAESKDRAFGTLVGTIEASLVPLSPELEPTRVAAAIPAESMAAVAVDAAPERELPPSRRLSSSATPGRSRAVEGTDADVVYERLRWTIAFVTLLLGTSLFGLGCGHAAALAWGAPVALAMFVRALTMRVEIGPTRLHNWLGLAVLCGAALAWSEPVLLWWQAGCGAAVLLHMPWLAGPVALAGLLRTRWPFALAAVGWALVVCATCWQLGGGCSVPTGGEASPVESVALRTPQAPVTAPRTSPDGRWPAGPSLSSLGGAASGSAGRVGLSRVESQAGTGEVVEPLTGAQLAAGQKGAGFEPEAGAADTTPPPADPRAPPRRFARPQSRPGGWVSEDHRRTQRDLVRISVEHATRSPAEFFGQARRRVYLPADRIFDPGTTRIKKTGELELSRLANLLSLHPERSGVLEVHTDAGGTLEDQRAISARQAAAIHDWLTSRGHIAPRQLDLRGLGGAQPLVPPDGSHAAQGPNRRIEVRLRE